jgi:hypothetical protein
MFFELLKDWNGQKAGTVLALTADDAGPLVRGGVVRAVADDPLGPVLTRSLETLINQTLRKIADAQAQSRRVAVPALFGDLGGSGDPKKSFGDWCLAVARNDRSYLEKHYGSTFNQCRRKATDGSEKGGLLGLRMRLFLSSLPHA